MADWELLEIPYWEDIEQDFGPEILALFRLLRTALKDNGKFHTDNFTTDGDPRYMLRHAPVKPNYLYVYLNNALIDNSALLLATETGEFQFSATGNPAANQLLTVEYFSYQYSDNQLYDYIEMALGDINKAIGTSYVLEGTPVDVSPTFENSSHKKLAILLCLLGIRQDESAAAATSMVAWRHGEKSVTTIGKTAAYERAVSKLQERIKQLILDINMSDTSGGVRQGGLQPGDHEYDTSDGGYIRPRW